MRRSKNYIPWHWRDQHGAPPGSWWTLWSALPLVDSDRCMAKSPKTTSQKWKEGLVHWLNAASMGKVNIHENVNALICAISCARIGLWCSVLRTCRIPLVATSLPAAEVTAPERKLECWNMPFFFCPTYRHFDVLSTNIHFEPSVVFTSSPLCLYTSNPSSTTTSYVSLSFCIRKI